ncbi:NADH-ubiquinone oxidoreductase chain 1 [Dendrobium catenatum]|uniref:NADH-ubiquinone oxidoreductase chain 1 n=1 Tax=Dendrobium catenatum TaxID=906689 RepID=A0A2I0VAJ2_9ASPA|nr:NADH-ubiquinone oxidoreductase chain 1 [Dendrobium catenatum]
MSRPILKEFRRSRTTKPPPKIKMSPTRPDFNSFSWFGQEGKKRYAAFYQPKRIPLLPRSFYRGRKRCGRTRGQSKLGYRAVSAVGVTEDVLVRFIVGYDILVDCWERPLYSKYAFLGALRSAAQMVPYEVSIGLILIVRLVSTFGSAKAIARMFP